MTKFQDGKTVFCGKYHETANYDMSNERIAVRADGKGGLTSYRVANATGELLSSVLSLDLAVNGKRLSPYLSKTVKMVGRMQEVALQTDASELSVTTFLDKTTNGVFFLLKGEGLNIDVCFNCRAAKSVSQTGAFVQGENFCLSSSAAGDWTQENDCFYASAKGEVKLLFSLNASVEEHLAAFQTFDDRFARCKAEVAEVAEVVFPASVQTEEQKALYLAAYFTALENHKTIGEFNAFAAGINYLDPVRTYYRDSYFTVLPLLSSRPELVKAQILTLAKGISEDGSCPSAVKSDFSAFWGDHYDSPSFFVLEVYDYVAATGDDSILALVGDKIKKVLAKLQTKTDETGLIYKDGDFNKRDWADEVNRNGYVTFVEALYYRALVAASRLFNGDLAASYAAEAKRVKAAVNDLLFDEEKGYYVNYKTKDETEDNLSVDTVFAVLFGIADEDRSRRVLDNMEKLLESQNNKEQEGGAFGVMCVYPPYKLPKAACNKSSRFFDYHNGANWCYLTAMYAYAKSLYGKDWLTPLMETFRYMTDHGYYTLIEYFSPCCPAGSPLQAWSAAMAFAFEKAGERFFK